MCGKWRNEFHLKWVPWPFVGFHIDSPHFITYKITNLSHPAFSVVFLSFYFLCLFDNSFFIRLLISRDMQICPTGCNVIICGSGRDICWLCSFKTVHFLDWYLYLKNNFVVTDAFIFYKGSCLWWMTKHRFLFFLIQEKFMQNWVLHWFFCSLSNSEWSPPHVRSKIEIYRNQPRSIVDYEPGFSSIAFQESKVVCKQIFFNKKNKQTIYLCLEQ